MLICTIMGEICMVAVQQKINCYGFLLLHCIEQKKKNKRMFRKYIEKWSLYDK